MSYQGRPRWSQVQPGTAMYSHVQPGTTRYSHCDICGAICIYDAAFGTNMCWWRMDVLFMWRQMPRLCGGFMCCCYKFKQWERGWYLYLCKNNVKGFVGEVWKKNLLVGFYYQGLCPPPQNARVLFRVVDTYESSCFETFTFCCSWVTLTDSLAKDFSTWQKKSNPKDLWPFRHLISVMTWPTFQNCFDFFYKRRLSVSFFDKLCWNWCF